MAVPNPERELERLRGVLRRGLPSLVLVSGPAGFFRAEAVDLVLAALPEDADVRVLSGEQGTDGRELQDLRGGSLFGHGCQVVVRRADRRTAGRASWLEQHGAALVELLPKMAPGCGLVLEAAKLDKRTKVGKALAKAAELFEFRALYHAPFDRSRSPLEAELVSWIQGRAKQHGLTLTAESALLLMHTVGTDPAECVGELRRLAPLLGDHRGPLAPQDIKRHLWCGFESTPFELAEALLDFDRATSERSLQAMFERGVRGREGDSVDRGGVFPFVSSWLYQAMAKAYEGRRLLDRGMPVRDVARALGVRVFVDRFQAQVQRNSQARLRRGLLLLHEAQRELRTTGEDPEWILRGFLLRYFGERAA